AGNKSSRMMASHANKIIATSRAIPRISLDFELEVAADGLCFWAVLGCWVPTWGRPTFFLFLDLPICQRIVFCESSFQSRRQTFCAANRIQKRWSRIQKYGFRSERRVRFGTLNTWIP